MRNLLTPGEQFLLRNKPRRRMSAETLGLLLSALTFIFAALVFWYVVVRPVPRVHAENITTLQAACVFAIEHPGAVKDVKKLLNQCV